MEISKDRFDAMPSEITREDLPAGHWALELSRPGERIPKGVLLIEGRSGPVTPEIRAWAEAAVRNRGTGSRS